MKQLTSSVLALIVALICTACASDGYTPSASQGNPADNRNSIGIHGTIDESGGSGVDMYGTVDESVGIRR